MPVWADYIYANGQRGGAMFERLCGIISDRLDNETYNEYLKESIEGQKATVLNLPEPIRRLLLMADSIHALSFDIDWFVEWETRLYNSREYRSASEKYEALSGIMNSLDRLRLGSGKFEAVLKALKESFVIELEAAERQLKEEQIAEEENEKALLEEFFRNPGLGCDEASAVLLTKRWNSLKTDGIRRFFRNRASEIITASAERLAADENIDAVRLQEGKSAVQKLMPILNADALNRSFDAIEKREKELKVLELQNSAPISLVSRKDIPALIRELYRREQVISNPDRLPDAVLILPKVPGLPEYQLTMHHSDAVSAAEFLIAPDNINAERFSVFVVTKLPDACNVCLKEMLYGGLFELSHYPYLKQIAVDLRDSELKRDFFNYFNDLTIRYGLGGGSEGEKDLFGTGGMQEGAPKGKASPFSDPFARPGKGESSQRGTDGRSSGLFSGLFKRS